MWYLTASYKFYRSGPESSMLESHKRTRQNIHLKIFYMVSVSTEQIKYTQTMTCLFKSIRCTIDVKYLTKQRCKKCSGTRRHHLLEWCNAITSERSRTLTIHSSPKTRQNHEI